MLKRLSILVKLVDEKSIKSVVNHYRSTFCIPFLLRKTLIINVSWFTSLQPLEKPPYSLEITTDFYARDTLHSSWQTPAMTPDEKPSVNYCIDLKDIF